MKTKTMKKALSLFLAVLMIALALPLTLLSISAEEGDAPDVVEIANVTFKARKTNQDSALNLRSAYGIARSFDGDVSTGSQSYGFSSYFPTYYLNADNAFAYDWKNNPSNGGPGKYYAVWIVELKAESTLENMTIWGGSDKTSSTFANDAYDIYYSLDGTSYTAVSGASFTDMTGTGSAAGANSALFREERTVTETDEETGDPVQVTYYGHKIDMNDANAKYVAIAVLSPTKNGNKDAVLREVEFEGTDLVIPVSVAGIQQGAGGIRLVGVTNSTKAAGVGFKLDATYTYLEKAEDTPASVSEIVYNGRKTNKDSENPHRSGAEINYAFDGDVTTSSQTYGFSSYFPTFYLDGNNAFQYNWKTNPSNGGPGKYYAVYIVELSALSVLEDMILWGGTDKTSQTFVNDAYDIYYSADGTSYTAVSGASFTGMTGTGSAAGANSALFSEERTVVTGTDEETGDPVKVTYYGHKIDMNDVEANYVAIAVLSPTKNNNKDAVLREVEVNGVVLADSITVTKTATVTTDATNVVYNSILADGETLTAKDIDAELYDENDKLYALGITGIPTDGTVVLEVIPYFIPVGSTNYKIYGDTASFEFVDGKFVDKNVKVMTYNLCNGQVNDTVLSNRAGALVAKINLVDPDIVALNEAHQYERSNYNIDMAEFVKDCDVNYGVIEFTDEECTNVTLYNRDKFEVVGTPEFIVLVKEDISGNASGDEWERTAIISKLRRIVDGEEIVVINTHLDTGRDAAKAQVYQLLSYTDTTYGTDVAKIFAGDFNYQRKDVGEKSGNMNNATSTVHQNYAKDYGYTYVNTELDVTATFPDDGTVIDYIYSYGMTPKSYKIITESVSSFEPSDHLPVYAELVLN